MQQSIFSDAPGAPRSGSGLDVAPGIRLFRQKIECKSRGNLSADYLALKKLLIGMHNATQGHEMHSDLIRLDRPP